MPSGKPTAVPGKPGAPDATPDRTAETPAGTPEAPDGPGTINQHRGGWADLLAAQGPVAAMVDPAPASGGLGSPGKAGATAATMPTDNPYYSTPFTGAWTVKVPETGEIWMVVSRNSPFGSAAYSGGPTSGNWCDNQTWHEPGSYGDPRIVQLYDAFGEELDIELTFTSPNSANGELRFVRQGDVYHHQLERSACDLRVAEVGELVTVPGCSWQRADGWLSEETARAGCAAPASNATSSCPTTCGFTIPTTCEAPAAWPARTNSSGPRLPGPARSVRGWPNEPGAPICPRTRPAQPTPRSRISSPPSSTRPAAPTPRLDAIFREVTGWAPKMWGPSIVGYGRYHYVYDSGREGEMCATGFSPRKANLVVYIMPGYADFSALLADLGKHKLGKSCLYLNKLADIDTRVF